MHNRGSTATTSNCDDESEEDSESFEFCMEGSSQSSLSETPAEFKGVTFRDVPNTFANLQRYWKEINRRYQELPDIEPEPSPLELCPDISLSDEQLEVSRPLPPPHK